MAGADAKAHWDRIWSAKSAAEASWFQPSPRPSLAWIEKTGLGPGGDVIDVGGGASSLVDHLLDAGFRPTVLDVAGGALEAAKTRLGARAKDVNWIVADITRWRPAATFDLWHDRAVFHFLTGPAERARYIAALKAGLRAGGWLILATFAPTGPKTCSGLTVTRWSAEGLAAELGEDFQLMGAAQEDHPTPGGQIQAFTWTLFRRVR